jgi:hypothetical protein
VTRRRQCHNASLDCRSGPAGVSVPPSQLPTPREYARVALSQINVHVRGKNTGGSVWHSPCEGRSHEQGPVTVRPCILLRTEGGGAAWLAARGGRPRTAQQRLDGQSQDIPQRAMADLPYDRARGHGEAAQNGQRAVTCRDPGRDLEPDISLPASGGGNAGRTCSLTADMRCSPRLLGLNRRSRPALALEHTCVRHPYWVLRRQ